MKRSSVLAIAFLSCSFVVTSVAQSTSAPAPVKTDAAAQTKQDKKVAKEKAKADKGTANAQSGKKTTPSQDAANALAYKQGLPKSDPK
jgi:hypothetical protein